MNPQSHRPSPPAWTRLLLLVGLAFVACVGIRTITGGEIWVHLASGRWMAENGGVPTTDPLSFTKAADAWINPSWLYDRMAYAVWQMGGASAVILAHVAAIVLAFALLIPVGRKWGGPLSVALALILSAWLAAPRLEPRPTLFGLLFAALFILMLTGEKKGWVIWLTLLPAQILWANMHGSFLLGPALCLLAAIDTAVANRRTEDSPFGLTPDAFRRMLALLGLAAGTLIVTLFNRYGFALHRHVIASWGHTASVMAQENVPPLAKPFSSPLAFHMVTAALIVGAIGLLAQRRRLPLGLTALAVITAYLAVRTRRYSDAFAVLSFPFFCLSLSAVGEIIEAKLERAAGAGRTVIAATGAALVIISACGSALFFITNAYYVHVRCASTFGLGVAHDIYPEAAMPVIMDEDFPEHAINLLMDGSYLAWRAPNRKVFVDQRAGLYGTNLYTGVHLGVQRGEEKNWQDIVDRWDPSAVIINACDAHAGIAVRNLMMGGRWLLAYFDGTTAILVQQVSRNAKFIANEEIQAAGLQVLDKAYREYAAALNEGRRPGIPPRLTGAGAMFMTLGQFHEAEAIYALLARGIPELESAWLNLGICQMELDRPQDAVPNLERACALAHRKNARPWLHLSRAYARSGLAEKAAEAFSHAEKINPVLAAAFRNPISPAKEDE